MSLPSQLQLNNLYTNPQLLGQLFPSINMTAIQSAFQAQQIEAQLPISQLSTQLSALSGPLSAWQTMQQDLQALQSDAANLSGSSLYQQVSASSSNTADVSVTPTGPGVTGTYTIGPARGQSAIVLAQNEIVNSASQGSDSTALNQTGSFTINGVSIGVSSTDSLSSIAAAINTSGAGVTAAVLQPPGGGYVLSLQGAQAGPLTFTDPNGILAGLGVLSAGSPNVVQNYQYAQYSVNGVDVTQGTSNTDATSIPGVRLTLQGGSGATVTVSQSSSAMVSAVQQFASDFNRYLSDYQKYAGKGGAIEGDPTLSVINNDLMQILASTVPGQPATLNSAASAGVTLSAPVGSPDLFSMAADPTTLQSAAGGDPGSFATLWNGPNGLATQINNLLTNALGTDGGVTTTIAGLTQQQTTLQQEIANPNSSINEVVNAQLQGLQSQFNQLMQSLVSLSGQSSLITSYTNMLSGTLNQSGGSSGG